MKRVTLVAFALLVILGLMSQTAVAGTIYTDRPLFLSALTSPLVAFEDFESFALGPVANPLIIMGGAAELLDLDPEIDVFTSTVGPSPSQAWIANLSSPGPVTIQGVGASSLGFTALGFDFINQVEDEWEFNHSLGSDTKSYFIGPAELQNFLGWIGAPGEILNFAEFGAGGIILDNMVAAAVPEPATMLLIGTGLVSLAAFSRRRFKN